MSLTILDSCREDMLIIIKKKKKTVNWWKKIKNKEAFRNTKEIEKEGREMKRLVTNNN